jgi:hypothetical protein
MGGIAHEKVEMDRATVFGAGRVPGSVLLTFVAQQCGGYTLTEGKGGWVDDGQLVEEPSWQLVMLGERGALEVAVGALCYSAFYGGEKEVWVTWERVTVDKCRYQKSAH